MRTLVPSLPRSAWQLLAAGSLSALANGFSYPFLVVYRDLSLGTAGLAAATIAVPLEDAPSRHVFAAVLPSAHRPAAVEAMIALLRGAARGRQ